MNKILTLLSVMMLIGLQTPTAQVASTALDVSTLLSASDDEAPVLSAPTIAEGKINFSWSSISNHDGQSLYELRIVAEKDLSDHVKQSQRPVFAEVIKGNHYEAKYQSLGLQQGETYSYSIRKVSSTDIDLLNATGFSPPQYFTLSEFPTCAEPKHFKILYNTYIEPSFTIKWVGNSSDISYIVKWKAKNATLWDASGVIVKSINNFHLWTPNKALTNNTEYEFYIEITCSNNGIVSTTNSQTTSFITGACQTSTPIVTTTVTGNEIKLAWTNIPMHEAYEIEYYEAPNLEKTFHSGFLATFGTGPLEYTIPNLKSNTQYKVNLRAACACSTINNELACKKISKPNNNITVTTLAPPCAPPSELTWLNSSPCGLDMKWAGAGNFEITATPNAAYYPVISKNVNGYISNTSYRLSGLEPGIYYNITVKRVCNGVSSIGVTLKYAGNPNFAIPAPVAKPIVTFAPEAPNNVKVTILNTYVGSYITLCYKKQNETNWNSQYLVGNGHYLQNLDPSATYDFKYFFPSNDLTTCDATPACEAVANSIGNTSSFKFPCFPPTNIQAQNLTANSVTFTMTPSSFATNNFTYRYRVVGTSSWSNVTTSLPIVVNNLLANKNYEFQFSHDCGYSTDIMWSVITPITTPAADVCENPLKTEVTISSITINSISLSWKAFANNNLYDFRYKIEGATNWEQQNAVTGTITTFNNLQAGKKYFIEMRRKVGIALCDWLILEPITTISNTCDPIDVTKVVFTPKLTSIKVDWEDGINPAQFKLRYRKVGDTEWAAIVTLNYSTIFDVSNLTNNTEYEFELLRICQNGESDWFAIGKAKTLKLLTVPEPKCDPNYQAPPSTSINLLSSIAVDEVFYMKGVPIQIKKLTNNNASTFSGEGIAMLPFVNTKLKVLFNAVKINTDYAAVDGTIDGKLDAASNYPNLANAVINLTDFSCTAPKPKPQFDPVTGKYQPGNKDTDPNGFNATGKYAAQPPYSCYDPKDKTDDKYDPRGFDNKGIHFETKTQYDKNGCDLNGVKADGKTLCTCYQPCDPCNTQKPYYWLNGGGAAPTVAGNQFAQNQKANLKNIIKTQLLSVIASTGTERGIRISACDEIRGNMQKKNDELKYEETFIYGDQNKYYAENMSNNFKSAPKAPIANSNGTRNPTTEKLEELHVDLYHCDIKVVAYNNYLAILNKLLAEVELHDTPESQLVTTIFELIRRLDDKQVADFTADPTKYNAWVFQQIEEYTKKAYLQEYGKALAYEPNTLPTSNKEKYLGFPPIEKEKPAYMGMGIADSGDNPLIWQQSQQTTLQTIDFELEQGFQTVAGVDRALILEALVNERNKTQVFSTANPDLLPIVLSKKLGENTYEIYIDRIHIEKDKALLDATLLIGIPNSNEKLILKGTNIQFGGGGLTDSSPKLYLQSKVAVGINNVARFVLKGSPTNSLTFAEWDCEGFKQLSIDADVEFCRNYFTPLDNALKPIQDPKKLVTASFITKIHNWGDFEVELKINNFAITKYSDYKFVVKDVIFDFSKSLPHNPKIKFPANYTSNYVDKGVAGIDWRGFYLGELGVTMPAQFKSKTTGTTTAYVEKMIIDDEGLTGLIGLKLNKPLISLDEGDMDGWAFSVDKLEVKVFQNEIAGGSFGGLVNIPVLSDKDGGDSPKGTISAKDCFRYKGTISPGTGEYILTVESGTERTFKMDMIKAKVVLADNTNIQIGVVNNKFVAKATLNGKITFLGDYTQGDPKSKKKMDIIPDIDFSDVVVSNTKPYFNPGNWGLPKKAPSFLGFKIGFSKMNVTEESGDRAALNMDVLIGLTGMEAEANITPPTTPPTPPPSSAAAGTEEEKKDKFKLDVKGGFKIYGKLSQDDLGRQRWVFDNLEVKEVLINGSFPGMKKLFGYAKFFDETTPELEGKNFGHGFQGGLDVEFDKLDVIVKAVALFGHTKNAKEEEYKYFMVDAMGYFDVGVNIGGLDVVGLGGGAYYHMTRDTSTFAALRLDKKVPIPTKVGESLTGISYYPNDEKLVGIRAMVAMALPKAEKAFNCNVLFGIEFNKNYGISEIMFLGNATFFDELKMDEVPKFVKGDGDPKAGYDLSIRASVSIIAKFGVENEFSANMMLYGNLADLVKGGHEGDRIGGVSYYRKGAKWHLNIGTPNEAERVSLLFAVKGLKLGAVKAYLCMGSNIPNMPPLPPNIQAAVGLSNFMANESTRKNGKGFAFGANMSFNLGEKEFLIFYGNFKADLGFDVMLKDYGKDTKCLNLPNNASIGMNGWYASGQIYAGIQASIGVKAKIGGAEIKVPILSMGAAVVLQAKLPNPFWARGAVGGYYSVMGGLVKGKCNFVITMGESCEIEGTDPNAQEPVIENITPDNKEEDVAVGSSIDIDFSVPMGQTTKVADPDDPNKSIEYTASLSYATLKRGSYPVLCKENWSEDKKRLTLIPVEFLPGNRELTVEAKAVLTKKTSASTVVFDQDPKVVVFKTGTATKNIYMDNVTATYPTIGQVNFHRKEYKEQEGYIMLKRSQENLFDDEKAEYKAIVKAKDGSCFTTDLEYVTANNLIRYDLPAENLQPNTVYSLQLAYYKPLEETLNNNVNDNSNKITGIAETCPSNLADWKVIYENYFRTSEYDLFTDKVKAVLGDKVVIGYDDKDGIYFIQKQLDTEVFDKAEIYGEMGNEPLTLFNVDITGSKTYENSFFKKFYESFPYYYNGQSYYSGNEYAHYADIYSTVPKPLVGCELFYASGDVVNISKEHFIDAYKIPAHKLDLRLSNAVRMAQDVKNVKISIDNLILAKAKLLNLSPVDVSKNYIGGPYKDSSGKETIIESIIQELYLGMSLLKPAVNRLDKGSYNFEMYYTLPGLKIKTTIGGPGLTTQH